MHRQGIELGVIAHRRVLQVLEKRAEKEQRRIRFDGLRRLRQIVRPVPPRASLKSIVTLMPGRRV